MTSLLGIGGSSLSFGKAATNQGVSAVGDQQSIFDKILDEFKKAASETPAERAADSVLKKHDLTREDLQRLPKDKQDAIEQEIAEAVKRALKVDAQAGRSASTFSAMI